MTDIRIDRQRLETLMNLRGFDNESLAKAMGKHYNSVLRLKQEQSTTFSNLEKLCEVLQCHPFDLIVAEGFPQPFLEAQASL
jgi:DNA-binding Xre family transcriptional regulator